jgi:hypothetical protein
MKVSTVTGADRDYVRLVPETVEECSQLVAVAVSKFIPADATLLVTSLYPRDAMELRVFVEKLSEKNGYLSTESFG